MGWAALGHVTDAWLCSTLTHTIAGKKNRTKAPKIQRLVTPVRLQRKRQRVSQKLKRRVKRREEAATYHQMMTKYAKVSAFTST